MGGNISSYATSFLYFLHLLITAIFCQQFMCIIPTSTQKGERYETHNGGKRNTQW